MTRDRPAAGEIAIPPSREFRSLPPEQQRKIESCLGEVPVKLGPLARSLGVQVRLATLPRNISGQLGREDGGFVIRINRHEAKGRQRFTLAHQLAHFLLHRDRIVDGEPWEENVLLRSDQPTHVENEANRLAFDLVIPPAGLARIRAGYSILTTQAIEELAFRFGLTKVVMEDRLEMLERHCHAGGTPH